MVPDSHHVFEGEGCSGGFEPNKDANNSVVTRDCVVDELQDQESEPLAAAAEVLRGAISHHAEVKAALVHAREQRPSLQKAVTVRSLAFASGSREL